MGTLTPIIDSMFQLFMVKLVAPNALRVVGLGWEADVSKQALE